MSKFWPLVMWFKGVDGMAFEYVPSWAHHKKEPNLPGFDSYDEAFAYAYGMRGYSPNENAGAIALFRPAVIEQPQRPNVELDPIVLRVTRIAVNEDGMIAPQPGYTQEKQDAA